MQPSLEEQIREQGTKLDAIYISVEKTRKYFQMVIWVSVAMFVLPLIGLIFVIPAFLKSFAGLEGLI